jgi:hypothetical protein
MKKTVLIAILLLIVSSTTFAKTATRLPFINDDFEKALLQAKQRNAPLFVDVWAPW